MSTVHVFVGQCGNQLGTAFLDSLAGEAEASRNEEYQMRVSVKHFRPALKPSHSRVSALSGSRQSGLFDKTESLSRLPQPRCVMVDMEPKVIEESIKHVNGTGQDPGIDGGSVNVGNPRGSFYCLAPQQCVTRGEGSANNWAYGYYHQGESRREAIAECLRRESEAQESDAAISTYHVVHSVAGGTGSGVGCLVAEVVRDHFPHAALLHSIVWPFAGGEVATQWYNTVLCMSSLRDSADAVCIAYNDVVANRLTQAQKTAAKGGARREGESSVSFHEMNRHIGRLLSPLHLPQLLFAVPPAVRDAAKHRIQQESVTRTVHRAPLPRPRRYACSEDIVESLALDPTRKFFTGLSVPSHAMVRESMAGSASGTSSWTAVLTDASRTSREAFAGSGVMGFSSRGALWVLRGQDSKTEGLRALQDVLASEPKSALGSLFISPDTGGKQSTVSYGDKTPTADGRPTHEVSLYGHAGVIPETLDAALQRAEKQMHVGAYLYQFERYGVDKDALRGCTARLWDTVYAYTGNH